MAAKACGLCFGWATNYIKSVDWDDTDTVMVHGMIAEPFKKSVKYYNHAWIEKGDMVYDWQVMEGGKLILEERPWMKPFYGIGFPKEVFYSIFEPKDIVKANPEEAMLLNVRFPGEGLWTQDQLDQVQQTHREIMMRKELGIDEEEDDIWDDDEDFEWPPDWPEKYKI